MYKTFMKWNKHKKLSIAFLLNIFKNIWTMRPFEDEIWWSDKVFYKAFP